MSLTDFAPKLARSLIRAADSRVVTFSRTPQPDDAGVVFDPIQNAYVGGDVVTWAADAVWVKGSDATRSLANGTGQVVTARTLLVSSTRAPRPGDSVTDTLGTFRVAAVTDVAPTTAGVSAYRLEVTA